jgi:hypothetical protein
MYVWWDTKRGQDKDKTIKKTLFGVPPNKDTGVRFCYFIVPLKLFGSSKIIAEYSVEQASSLFII